MALHKFTVEELRAMNIPEAKAQEIIAAQTRQVERTKTYVVKGANQERLIRLAKENPDLTFAPRFVMTEERKAKLKAARAAKKAEDAKKAEKGQKQPTK